MLKRIKIWKETLSENPNIFVASCILIFGVKEFRNILLFCLGLSVSFSNITTARPVASADTIIAEGRFIMGDRDTKADGREYALLEAKRKVLEQVGTYLKSKSTVENFILTEQEIETYSAGLIRTEILEERTEPVGETIAVVVKIRAIVDPQEVQDQIVQMKQEENSSEELTHLREDYNRLVTQLDSLKREVEVSPPNSEQAVTHPQGEEAVAESFGREEKWNELKRTELLIQLIVESNKPRPDLSRMKNLSQRILQTYPQMNFVHGYLGIAYYKHHQFPEAIRNLRIGLQKQPSWRLPAFRKNLPPKAKIRYQKEQALFNYYLAKCLFEGGQGRQALRYLQEAQRLDPGNKKYKSPAPRRRKP